MRTSEGNCYQNSLTFSNINFASITSDSLEKTTHAGLNEVLSTEVIDEAKITKLTHGNYNNNKGKIIESLKKTKK